jgi:hypothetical protein
LSGQANNLLPEITGCHILASKPLVILGNLFCILLAIAGLLQYVSWTIAGALIIITLAILTLGPLASLSSQPGIGHSSKKSGGRSIPETRLVHDKTQEKQNLKPHMKNEPQKASSEIRTEFQKTMTPRVTPPKTIPTNFSPTKPDTRPGSPTQGALRPIPPGSNQVALSPPKPAPPKLDPNTRVLARGDYASFDVKLDRGIEVVCDVTASAPINVYLLNKENLDSLDMGEEFWSETGEEDVAKATLSFVAQESGDWFLVVENTDHKEASATVKITKRPAKSASNQNA